MSSSFQALEPARIHLDAHGVPVSTRFGDIYYAGEQPLQQARDVFIRGNGLPQRWHHQDCFTILETGFGLGLNFLAVWQAWRDDVRRPRHLHFVSIEAHPFQAADLKQVLGRLQGAEKSLAHQLIASWPPLVPGIHRLEFEAGALTLTLAFGPVRRMARQLDLGFDACFLDGFSPRLNPEMWTPDVFSQLARLARRDATLATWCSAGQVRRDLQNAGFLIQRHSGFGRKRHRISGWLRPNLGQSTAGAPRAEVIVLGAGFAGASAAWSLAARRHGVHVIDPALAEGLAGTHIGHRWAAMTPLVSRDDDMRSRLTRAGAGLAQLRWQSLPAAARPQQCGSFEPIAFEQHAVWQQALARLRFPETVVRWVGPNGASALTGVALRASGLWHAQGCRVEPAALLTGLLSRPEITTHARAVAGISRGEDGVWVVRDARGNELARASQLVLATAGHTARLLRTIGGLKLPARLGTLHRIAGQVSNLALPASCVPSSILSGDGLCVPDAAGGVIGGSTYMPDSTLSIITAGGHQEIREKVAGLLELDPSGIGLPRGMADGWAGWRAAVRDRLPVIGPVADTPGLWLACGFGSRGLIWSALGAELIAARLNHEPIPLERELSRKIAPA